MVRDQDQCLKTFIWFHLYFLLKFRLIFPVTVVKWKPTEKSGTWCVTTKISWDLWQHNLWIKYSEIQCHLGQIVRTVDTQECSNSWCEWKTHQLKQFISQMNPFSYTNWIYSTYHIRARVFFRLISIRRRLWNKTIHFNATKLHFLNLM